MEESVNVEAIMDEAIAAATPEVSDEKDVATEPTEPEVTEPEVEEETDTAPDENAEEDDTNTEEKDPWPKKAKNALSRRDKKIDKLQAKIDYLEQQTNLAKEKTGDKSSSAPKADDYDDYDSYIGAVARYEAENVRNEGLEQEKQSLEQIKAQQHHEARVSAMDANAKEAGAAIPDFDNVMLENQDVIGDMQPHVREAFLNAENGAYAFYSLAKDGGLDDLNQMNPYQVYAAVTRAEDKAVAFVNSQKEKKVTKAPAPQKANKGTGGVAKSKINKVMSSNNPSEILDWMRS